MFNTNGVARAAPSSGVVRLGETVPETRTIAIGDREYTAYVWGKRMPRSNEARVRQAALEMEEARALDGDPSPALMDAAVVLAVREMLASGQPAADMVRGLQAALESRDKAGGAQRTSIPIWQTYITRVLCGLVEGLSPIQADLLDGPEVQQILFELHFPGFWKDPEAEPVPERDPTTATTTTTRSLTGSTSRERSRKSPTSASPSNAA